MVEVTGIDILEFRREFVWRLVRRRGNWIQLGGFCSMSPKHHLPHVGDVHIIITTTKASVREFEGILPAGHCVEPFVMTGPNNLWTSSLVLELMPTQKFSCGLGVLVTCLVIWKFGPRLGLTFWVCGFDLMKGERISRSNSGHLSLLEVWCCCKVMVELESSWIVSRYACRPCDVARSMGGMYR